MLFEEQFRQYRASLMLIACRILGGQSEAAEAVENCFLQASRKPPKFESVGAFGSWIHRILINEALLARHHANCRKQTYLEQDSPQGALTSLGDEEDEICSYL
jgi:DNA-directed RNA polymerase specialized sigma24 family protein